MREITYTEALLEAFARRCAGTTGCFTCAARLGLLGASHPRVWRRAGTRLPISEEAYVGASIGAAGSGFRPIVTRG